MEAVKDRLYRPEIHGITKKEAAQYTFYNVLYKVLRFLCPVIPHLTEEIYQTMYLDSKKHQSISLASWPKSTPQLINEEIENKGDMIVALITEVRRQKSENRLPLNTPIKTLTIYTKDTKAEKIFQEGTEDISGTCKVKNLKILLEKAKEKQLSDYPEIQFKTEY